jgi:hypothetical protein
LAVAALTADAWSAQYARVAEVRVGAAAGYVGVMTAARRAEIFLRLWWVYLVLAVGYFVLAGFDAVSRDRGWRVELGFWIVLGLSFGTIGVLLRHVGRRNRR